MDKYDKRFLIIIVSWLVCTVTLCGLKGIGLLNPIHPLAFIIGLVVMSILCIIIIEHLD